MSWSSPTTTRARRTPPPSAPRCSPARTTSRRRPGARCSRSATGGRRSPTAVGLAGPGDTLLVAGKGHETGQEIAGTVHALRRPRGAARGPRAGPDGGAGMIALTLAEVAELAGGALTGVRRTPRSPASVTLDSRTVAAGDLFVAVAGERVDGHDFLRGRRGRRRGRRAHHAARTTRCRASWSTTRSRRWAGWPPGCTPGWPPAACARWASPARRARPRPRTCSARCWPRPGPTVSPPGSYNNDIGLPLTVLDADERTRFLVLEMGARGRGHIARLCRVARPAGRRGAQRRLGAPRRVRQRRRRSPSPRASSSRRCPSDGTAVLNADDPRVIGMAPRTARPRGHHRPGRGRRRPGRRTSSLDDAARARFTLVAGGRASTRSRCRSSASTRWPTRCRPPAPRWRRA